MSIIINDSPGPARSRRRPLVIAGVAVAVVIVLVAAFVLGRADATSPGPDRADNNVAGPGAPTTSITWSKVGTQPVPGSAQHGPFQTSNGMAAGFTHDELGAVLAAINISARITSAAGPGIYETTARQQCIGDVDAALATIRNQRSSSAPGSAIPSAFYYKISGDPNGDVAVVSVAAETPETTAMGGFGAISRTMQWVDGDWKLQIPASPPRVISSVTSYVPLGQPDA